MNTPPRGKSGNTLPLLVILAALALSGIAWFTFTKVIPPRNNTRILPTQTPATLSKSTPAPSEKPIAAAFSVTPFPLQDLNKDALMKKIEENTSPKMIAEKADISLSDKSRAAFFGHDENWSMFGLYLIDLNSFSINPVYVVNESIGGRGGYYMDNSALEFSPTGEALFMNRTGINFPSFLITDKAGKILLNNQDMGAVSMGHATWINGRELIYLDKDTVRLYDTQSRTSSPTKLPLHIFHLRANPKGTRVAAFTEPKNRLDCESFDLHVYSYPEGAEVVVEPNALIPAQWKNDTAVGFKKVTGCTKNGEESMFPYSPETAEKTLEVQ